MVPRHDGVGLLAVAAYGEDGRLFLGGVATRLREGGPDVEPLDTLALDAIREHRLGRGREHNVFARAAHGHARDIRFAEVRERAPNARGNLLLQAPAFSFRALRAHGLKACYEI